MIELCKRIVKFVFYRLKYIKKDIWFPFSARIGGFKSSFEGNNRIGNNSDFTGELGRCSYIGDNCKINASIGRYCSIASYVRTVEGKHPTSGFISSSPVFYSLGKQCGTTYVNKSLYNEYTGKVIIGNDVWIGEGAIIVGKVIIGHGAIIAAGAVVTKDVDPYSLVGGVPAKCIKKRFSDEIISKLINVAWWNNNENWINKNAINFQNTDLFFKCLGIDNPSREEKGQ